MTEKRPMKRIRKKALSDPAFEPKEVEKKNSRNLTKRSQLEAAEKYLSDKESVRIRMSDKEKKMITDYAKSHDISVNKLVLNAVLEAIKSNMSKESFENE